MTADSAFEAGLRAALTGALPVVELSREEIARLCAEQDAHNRVVEIARRWKRAREAHSVGAVVSVLGELAEAVTALEALSVPQTASGSRPTTEPISPATRTHSPQDEPNCEPIEYLNGCPVEVWDGPYQFRCAQGLNHCARHGRFERARRCSVEAGCRRPEDHGGKCDPTTREDHNR